MRQSVPTSTVEVLSSDRRVGPGQAKADLRKPETQTWRAHVGRIVERTRTLSGLQLQEFAAALGKNERQVRNWINATERAHLDAILAVKAFQPLFLVAVAHEIGNTAADGSCHVELETLVRVRA